MTKSLLQTARDLAEAGLIAPGARPVTDEVAARYAVAITPVLAGLVRRDDPADAIARQFVPTAEELVTLPQEHADPIGDDAHSPVAGIVHRHADRVLFKIANTCPVYCRFCFRRAMIGPDTDSMLAPERYEAAFAYIAEHPEIWEVILTGGDPFILSSRRIGDVSARLAAIPHVKIARWHTRVPVVDPGRVTKELVQALKACGVTSAVVLHANHPREFTADACVAIARIVDAGIPMFSQSVLLKGVNDDVETLAALMRGFVENRVKPYYLHHPDLAPGTSHFRLSIAEGRALVRRLRAQISGLAMPAYVLDIPGGHAKVPLLSDDVVEAEPGRYRVRDHGGHWHAYPPD